MNPQDPWRPAQPQQPVNGALPPVDPSQYPATPAPQPQVSPPQPGYAPQPLTTPGAPTPTSDYSIDYLNSIAPNQQKMASKFAVFGLIGGVLVAAIFAVILISAPKGTPSTQSIPSIAGRIETLQVVTAAQQKHLNENEISETNAALNSALGTMDTDVQAIIKDQKIKNQKSTAESAYSDKLSKTLDDAYQRGTLDRIYTTQMTYELTILETQINALKKSNKTKAIQSFCESAISNIEIVLKSYNSFEATKQ